MKRLRSLIIFRLNSSKAISVLLVAVIFCASLVSLVGPAVSVKAATTSSSQSSDVDWQIKSLLYYRSLTACLISSGMNGGDSWTHGGRIDNEKINSGEWFSKSSNQLLDIAVPIGVYLHDMTDVGDDGIIGCNQPGLVRDALSLWGLDAATVLCNIGMQRVDMGSNQSKSECINGKTQLERPAWSGIDGWPAGAMAFQKYIRDTIYGGNEPSLLDSEWYTFYKTTLSKSCISGIGLAPSPDTKASDNQLGYNDVKFVDLTRFDQAQKYQDLIVTGSYSGDKKKSDTILTRAGALNGVNVASVIMSCEEATVNMSKYADAYAQWAFGNIDEAKNSEANRAQDPGGSGDTKPTCGNQVSGLGWIVCPIIDGLTNLNDMVWGVVSGLLKVSPLRADGSESIYSAWGILRSIANVAFIIVFLLMIFSQLTNFGISNYGVKKLLPRLLVSALLVNLSFIIVQLSVDLANILGSSLYDLLANLNVNGTQPPTWTSLIDIILGAGAGVGIAVGGLALAGGVATAFWLLLPVAAMGALSLLAAIFTLIFRQAVIPILAILAPLAFVAYMLPNTETWFKKWRDLMLSMLMLYPLAAVVFGGAQFASIVIIGDDATWWSTLLGLIVLTLPLFSLPFLARQGGPLLGKVGGALSGLANKARDPLRNVTRPYADRSRANYLSGQRGLFGNRRSEQRRARRRTMGETLNEQRKNVEKDTENAKSTSERNWSQRGLDGRGRTGRRTGQILDEEKTLGLENKAVGAQYDARLEGRRVRNGRERLASDQLSDAEKTGKMFQGQQELRQTRRTNNNAQSTVAHSIGMAGVDSLGSISQDQFVASKAVAAGEAQIKERNDVSGAADQYIQQEKAATLGSKVAEAEQDTVFEVRKQAGGDMFDLAAQDQAQKVQQETLKKESDQLFTEATTGSDDARLDVLNPAVRTILQEAQRRSDVATSATGSAQKVQQQEYAEDLLEDADLATDAGGVDIYGASRVRASATAQVREARAKAVSAELELFDAQARPSRDFLQIVASGNLPSGEPANEEQIEAAIQYVFQKGTVEQQTQMMDVLEGGEFHNYAPDPNDETQTKGKVGESRGVPVPPQILQALGKVVVSSKLRSVGGSRIGTLQTGQGIPGYAAMIKETVGGGKFRKEMLGTYDYDELTLLTELVTRGEIDSDRLPAMKKTIEAAILDDDINTHFGPREYDKLKEITDYIDTKTPPTP